MLFIMEDLAPSVIKFPSSDEGKQASAAKFYEVNMPCLTFNSVLLTLHFHYTITRRKDFQMS